MSGRIINSCFKMQVEEIQIEIPFGHIAAKWWGPKNVRPIVAIHNSHDNAGSFDAIIPLLPQYMSYLVIDMPGHGKSSKLPGGMLYGLMQDTYILNFIFKQYFKWEKISLMGHSMGAIISFLFAANYPDRIDMVIALDALGPEVATIQETHSLLSGINFIVQADLRNEQNEEPISYKYTELVNTFCADRSISNDNASHMLKRAVKQSFVHTNRHYLTTDSRLKFYNKLLVTKKINRELSKCIQCPFLVILCSDTPSAHYRKEYDSTIQILNAENSKFELHRVKGHHYVHLSHPEKISSQLTQFINKYRPEELPASRL